MRFHYSHLQENKILTLVLRIYTLYISTETAKFIFKIFVSAINIFIFINNCFAFCHKTGNNHSGTGTEWFQHALGDASSPYRNYYVFSDNPSADASAGRIDNWAGARTPGMGDWYNTGVGVGYKGRLHFKVDWSGTDKTVTVTESTATAQSSNPSASKWIWIGSVGAVGLYETATDIHEITLDVDTDWGFLVRTTGSSSDWSTGTKWGTPAGGKAIVTSGFMKEMLGKGIEQMTSIRYRDRIFTATEFMSEPTVGWGNNLSNSLKPITFPVMEHRNNTTWCLAKGFGAA